MEGMAKIPHFLAEQSPSILLGPRILPTSNVTFCLWDSMWKGRLHTWGGAFESSEYYCQCSLFLFFFSFLVENRLMVHFTIHKVLDWAKYDHFQHFMLHFQSAAESCSFYFLSSSWIWSLPLTPTLLPYFRSFSEPVTSLDYYRWPPNRSPVPRPCPQRSSTLLPKTFWLKWKSNPSSASHCLQAKAQLLLICLNWSYLLFLQLAIFLSPVPAHYSLTTQLSDCLMGPRIAPSSHLLPNSVPLVNAYSSFESQPKSHLFYEALLDSLPHSSHSPGRADHSLLYCSAAFFLRLLNVPYQKKS